MLRVQELTVDASDDGVIVQASILKELPTGWKHFGVVTTSDPQQMQALQAWFNTGIEMLEDVFFGVEE